MTAHAKLSASGAHRWMNCPGSVKAEAGYGDNSSPYAQEGTNAHELADHCLINDVDAEFYVGDGTFGVDVTEEMAENVQKYLDYVRSLPGDLHSEQRVEFDTWVPGGFGTADAVVVHEGKCTVADLKYGKGVPVSAEDNPQLKLYALGVYSHFEFIYEIDTFRLAVVMPRYGADGYIDEWEISVEDLLEWGERVKDLAEIALRIGAPRVPGESQCRWCKAKNNCKAAAEHHLAVIADGFETIQEPIEPRDPDGLSNADIGAILPQIDTIRAWLSVIEARAADEIQSGNEVPGYKMVAGRTSRAWTDEEAAEKSLKRLVGAGEAYTKKLLTPPQAEKKIKDKKQRERFMSKYVESKVGAPTLVPESNKKPALEFNPAEGFETDD